MTIAAKIISILFHPLFMVTYLLAILAICFPSGLDPLSAEMYFDFILTLSGITLVMPLILIGLFKIFGMIQSATMVSRKERVMPFFFMAAIYTTIIIMLSSQQRIGLDDNLMKFLVITDILVLISFVTTLFFKVSVHSLAVWGVIGILLPLNKISEDGALFYPLLISFIVAGLVMASRLKLQVHSVREVWIGAVMGIAVSYTAMLMLF